MTQITLQAKLVGRRGPALAPLVLELEEPVRTARELLAAVVRRQIGEFKERKYEAGLLRVLTERDVEVGREAGRIVSGDQEPDDRVPDLEQSIAAAITAFEDGLYFMFANDVQVEDLKEPMADVANVLFVRLTPLAGG